MKGPAEEVSYAFVHDKVVRDFVQHDEKNEKQGVVGFMNLGNTCYLNTALQCLVNTNALTEYFLGFPWYDELNRSNPIGAGGKLAEEFGLLVSQIWEKHDKKNSKYKIISPVSFKKTLGTFQNQFSGKQQQDVQELLAFLLDGLHEDLNRVIDKPHVPEVESEGRLDRESEIAVDSWRSYLMRNRSIIVDIFQGQLRNALKCMFCNYKSLKFDPYMYMSLPCNTETVSLQDCLVEFCRPEILSGASQWYCPKCKNHRDAEKKLDMWISPPIFIVHLKRFMQDSKGKRSKIDTLIDFPLINLDLTEFLGKKSKKPQLYNLYGVANHHGTLARGHYTAFVRNNRANKWYKFNDSKIQEIVEGNVVTKSAYVLFYNKVQEFSVPESTDYIGDNESIGKIGVSTLREQKELSPMKMLTVDMIRRQSITIPHHWPHNVSSVSESIPFGANTLQPCEEDIHGEENNNDIENMPRPSFFLSPKSSPNEEVNISSARSIPDNEPKTKRKYSKRNYPVNELYSSREKRRRVTPQRYCY